MRSSVVIPTLYQYARKDVASLHGALVNVKIELEMNQPQFRCVNRGNEVELEIIDETRIIRLAYAMNKFVAHVRRRYDN